LIPVQTVQKLFPSSLTALSLQYGPLRGDGDFLEELATWLNSEYNDQQVPVSVEHLVLTSGASQSLSNLITLFTDPLQTVVLMEDPTYFLARGVFLDHSKSFDIRPIPQTDKVN
jgi:DNA-binding transcriptional MocR family regulator